MDDDYAIVVDRKSYPEDGVETLVLELPVECAQELIDDLKLGNTKRFVAVLQKALK